MTTFTDDDPRHGTHAGFMQHYKNGDPACQPCADAEYRHSKAVNHRLSKGIRNRIPLGDRAWEIVHGTNRTQLAHATGISSNMLSRLHGGGPSRIVLRSTQERILRAELPFTPVGIQRRVQALTAIGYSGAVIATAIGANSSNVCALRNREVRFVRHDFATRIIAFYDAHHMKPATDTGDGSVVHVTRLARRRGWLPPLAWDDIDRDDVAPSAPPGFRDTLGEYDHLRHGGVSHHDALETLDIDHNYLVSLQRRRRRAEEDDQEDAA